MPVPDASSDAYAVLGVDRNADDKTIASAHRRLARRHHPDLAGESATRRMMHINAAFEATRDAAAPRGATPPRVLPRHHPATGPAAQGPHPVDPRAASSTSGGMSAGRSARSRA